MISILSGRYDGDKNKVISLLRDRYNDDGDDNDDYEDDDGQWHSYCVIEDGIMVNNTFNYLLEDQTCYYGKHVQVPSQGTHWTQFWTKGEIINNQCVALAIG